MAGAPRSFTNLVVIGSSAGGVDALSILVSTLPANFSAPIILAQHLDPTRASHLGDILARRTTLSVRTVAEHEPLAPGVIYVVPANRNVFVSDESVEIERDGDARPKPSVDLLLSSASEVYGEHLIAVILSGTGSDGAAGARAVKKAGGTVIIQNPDTAAYPGMPLSLAPTTVDIIANLERIGPILGDLLAGASVPSQPDERHVLESFLEEVRERFGLDFNSYKAPTILRRLQRRIIATDTDDLQGYIQHLRSHPDEYQQLVNAFLIKVTEFFRDADLYTYVQNVVVPEIIAYARRHGNEIRVWSAGCATGEEAYSLAIMLSEALGSSLEHFNVHIFATDADPGAVAFARRGVYPAAALARVPEDLLARYFIADESSYQVKKRVRSLAVFGQHDLGQRAPFPHIDMVFCRNVLIYFTPELQQRSLRLFAYSLRDGGYLALGRSESPGAMSEFFRPINDGEKIYRREGERILLPPAHVKAPPLLPLRGGLPTRRPGAAVELTPGQKEIQRVHANTENVVSRLPIGVIIVDRHYDIQTINSAARRFLSIHGSAIGEDLVHLAETTPSAPLRSAIDAALRDGVPTEMEQFAVEDLATGEQRYYQISCHPQRFEREDGPSDVVMVIVQDATSTARALSAVQERLESTSDKLDAADSAAREESTHREQLVRQLVQTNRQLLEANQELTSANEELRTTNEEFLMSTEEAQAAIEEVETLNEELQATNEELETLNEELQSTIEELNTTYDDLHARSVELQDLARTSEEERAQLSAILISMADAVLVVDEDGATVLTNAAFSATFGNDGARLVPQDENGRDLPAETSPVQRAARGESFTMEFTTTPSQGDRRWYEVSGQKLGALGSGLTGGVLIFRDITERSLHRLQDEFLALASHELRTPIQPLRTALEMVHRSLGAQTGNEQLRHATDIALEQTHRLTRLVDDLLDASRLQTGKYTLNRERLRLDELTRHVAETARMLAGAHQIALLGEDGPLPISGDARRLEQAILNLISNAVKYAPDSETIELLLRREGQEAILDVRDHGPGIAESDLPHLFTRFFQVARSAPDWVGGLGLGLYIAQEIA
ncbi:MAG TPA: CheR family methyltransferase, partial [Ktedonobacterales bacterium]|nr:CheR family methyltransferase [Ktedonobacterales bacterium]